MTDIKCTVNNDRMSIYKYDTDKFKSENVSVYFSIPTCKEKSVARSLLLSVLKRGTEKYPTQRLINERLDELYATLVNLKNQKFDNVQLEKLLKEVLALKNINTCPHGRPIIITMEKKEIEKEFKRIL